MASLILLNIRAVVHVDWERDMRHSAREHPYKAWDAIIAKGNCIEGIEAVY